MRQQRLRQLGLKPLNKLTTFTFSRIIYLRYLTRRSPHLHVHMCVEYWDARHYPIGMCEYLLCIQCFLDEKFPIACRGGQISLWLRFSLTEQIFLNAMNASWVIFSCKSSLAREMKFNFWFQQRFCIANRMQRAEICDNSEKHHFNLHFMIENCMLNNEPGEIYGKGWALYLKFRKIN